MEQRMITLEMIENFADYLHREERAPGTVQKYVHDLDCFYQWLHGRSVTKEQVSAWREGLLRQGKSPGTVNGQLSSLHSFFAFQNWPECRVKYLRIQRRMFRDVSKDLTREDYIRLVEAARQRKNHRLALLLETICATGIRVSEVQFITVEALRRERADISLKGKIRTILIPGKLCRKLLKYAHKKKIASGEVFLTAKGTSLSRRQIWGEMKRLCQVAGVNPNKAFPHNLRHLFARSFYKVSKDIVALADILGHSSMETTRLYLISTSQEHAQKLDRLMLLL